MIILIIIATALCLAIPVKCYQDGEYKRTCLEMRGRFETDAGIDTCILPDPMENQVKQ